MTACIACLPLNDAGGFEFLESCCKQVAANAFQGPAQFVDLSVSVQFKTEDFAAWMAIDDQQVTMGLGEAPEPDVTVNGTIKDLFTGPRSPDELCASDAHEKLGRFMSAFAQRA